MYKTWQALQSGTKGWRRRRRRRRTDPKACKTQLTAQKKTDQKSGGDKGSKKQTKKTPKTQKTKRAGHSLTSISDGPGSFPLNPHNKKLRSLGRLQRPKNHSHHPWLHTGGR